MALRVRTPQLVDVLLDHVEANKGSNGLYICDYEAALIQATQVLAPFAMHLRPPVLMNASRIKHKLYDMVRNTNGRRERNGMRIERKDLFEQGRISLSPSYQKDVLVGVRPRNGSENYHPMPSQLAVPVPHQGSMTALPPSSKTSRRKKADSDMDFEPSQSPCFNDEGDEERGSKTIAAQGSETGTTPLTIEPVYDQETTEVIDLLEEDLSTELGDSSSPKPDVGITNSEDDDAEGAENDPEEEHNDAEEDDSEDCPAAIKEYMLDDPEHAVPKTKKLQTDCVRLIEEIHEAVEELLFMVTLPGRQNNPRNMKTPGDDELPPDIARALSRNPFYNLCLRTYGASNHHTLDASLRGSLISTKEFTRALLGAAIDEWVFNDGHHHLPDLKNRDITAISQALETDLARSKTSPIGQRVSPLISNSTSTLCRRSEAQEPLSLRSRRRLQQICISVNKPLHQRH